jgi:hypothetical protein
MSSLILGSLLISLLHAVIPSHWLPVVAIGRKEKWTMGETVRVTFVAGLSHVLSTVLIGFVLGVIGAELKDSIATFTAVIAPSVLILMGFYFIRQHFQHHHFHINKKMLEGRTKKRIIIMLVLAMFMSPCMEIEGYFLMAGSISYWLLTSIALMYAVISLGGMMIWVWVAYKGAWKLNWHALEHNAGIITGIILIATGIVSFFIY